MDPHLMTREQLLDEVRRLRDTNGCYKGALLKYGTHKRTCCWHDQPDAYGPCDCGLRSMLAALDAEKEAT